MSHWLQIVFPLFVVMPDACCLDHTASICPTLSVNHEWCNSQQVSVALCCTVAGKGDVPFATIPKNYPKQLTKKWALFANFDLW